MTVKTVERERMSMEEAEEVMRLWQERQSEGVAVTDLAEALAAPEEELAVLLDQVRKKRNDFVIESVKPSRMTLSGVLSVCGMAMCSFIAITILTAALGPPFRGESPFFYLFCGLSFVFVPLATYALHLNRKQQILEESQTKKFLLKIQRQHH